MISIDARQMKALHLKKKNLENEKKKFLKLIKSK